MAYITERSPGRWMARVRKTGHPEVTDTFRTRALAEAWAKKVEGGVDSGASVDHRELKENDVRSILERYREEVSPGKKVAHWEFNKINQWLGVRFVVNEEGGRDEVQVGRAEPWTYLTFDQDIASGLQAWRDRRVQVIKGQSFNRELNCLSAIFTHAAQEWKLRIPNPVKMVKRPKTEGGYRDVTWTPKQVELFCNHVSWTADEPVKLKSQWLGWVLQLALATGLRRGTLCATRMEWIDLENDCIHYPADVVKAGEPYDMPLEGEGYELLLTLIEHRAGEEKLIGISADSATTYLISARTELQKLHPDVAGLRLHDVRHTYTTELVEVGIPMPELMKSMGRSSIKDTMRYYNPKAKTLAQLITEKRAAAAAKKAKAAA